MKLFHFLLKESESKRRNHLFLLGINQNLSKLAKQDQKMVLEEKLNRNVCL